MRYVIITNPVSGRLNLDQKRKLLDKAAGILDANVVGLEVGSREEFSACAKEVASSVDVLVVAGGDGSVSDVINAVDTSQTPIAYLPRSRLEISLWNRARRRAHSDRTNP